MFPAVGNAYSIESIVDDKLTDCTYIYFEAGNHEDLIHMKGSSFRRLIRHSEHTTSC